MKTHTIAQRAIRYFASVSFIVTAMVAGGCFQEPAPGIDVPGLETEGGLKTRVDDSEGLFCDLCAVQGCACYAGECVNCRAGNLTSETEVAEGLFCDVCSAQGCDCDGDKCTNCEAGSFTTPDPEQLEGLFCDLCSAQGCDCEGGECVDCGGGKLTTKRTDGDESSAATKTR